MTDLKSQNKKGGAGKKEKKKERVNISIGLKSHKKEIVNLDVIKRQFQMSTWERMCSRGWSSHRLENEKRCRRE